MKSLKVAKSKDGCGDDGSGSGEKSGCVVGAKVE